MRTSAYPAIVRSFAGLTGIAGWFLAAAGVACLPLQRSVTGRSDTTVKLQWKPLGHEISKLVLQYAILNGKSTFEDVKKNGGRDVVLADPQTIDTYLVKRLVANTNYVFRLIAYNQSGKSTGAMCGPIKTVTFTPGKHLDPPFTPRM